VYVLVVYITNLVILRKEIILLSPEKGNMIVIS